MCGLRCLSSCRSLSRHSFQLPVCQTVSDAGRILLLRVFSRNPRWCEASVPKLSEHQATPAECNYFEILRRIVVMKIGNAYYKANADYFECMFLRGGTMVTRSPNSFASTEYAPGPRKMRAAAVSILKI